MSLENVKKGDQVFIVSQNYNRESQTCFATVTSRGHKYIGVDGRWDRSKFHIDSGVIVTDYSPNVWAYATEKEYRDKVHRDKLEREVQQFFNAVGGRRLTTEQLEAILAIVGND